mmetsp:Transcript_40061/g.88954  ORF Transcript_40061/g.88954 Transcript_40061/m.88954 type:complete len:112 (+) Transcript_40061:148-483(+)
MCRAIPAHTGGEDFTGSLEAGGGVTCRVLQVCTEVNFVSSRRSNMRCGQVPIMLGLRGVLVVRGACSCRPGAGAGAGAGTARVHIQMLQCRPAACTGGGLFNKCVTSVFHV